MEEILASIRRIIADDVAGEVERAVPAAVARVPQADVSPAGAEDAAAPGEPPEAAAADPAVPEAGETVPASEPVAADPAAYEDEAVPDEVPMPVVLRTRPLPAALRPVPRAPEAASEGSVAFAAALMDLSVEQTVSSERSAPSSRFSEAVPAAAAASVHPHPAAKTSPEITDMQVQAKSAAGSPAAAPSRSAATPLAERRHEEAEVPRGFERPALARTAFGEAETGRPNRLISGAAGEQVAGSFGALARAVASNTRSMEDVVTDALRPLLKSWLDEHLPELVERLVRDEIERVARHGQ